MGIKLEAVKESGKLSAYVFVILGLAGTALTQLKVTQGAVETAFKTAKK